MVSLEAHEQRLALTPCECLTTLGWRKINKPISFQLNPNACYYGRQFLLFFLFLSWSFPCHTFIFIIFIFLSLSLCVARRAALGISFHGSPFCFFQGGCGSTCAEVHWGNSKKGRDTVAEIKVCHFRPALCESARHHRRRGERR